MKWVARALWSLTVLLVLVAVWLVATPKTVPPLLADQGFPAFTSLMIALAALGYATSGLLILRRRPRHAVGTLLLVAGLVLAVIPVAFGVGTDMLARRDSASAWVLLLGTLCFWPSLFLAGPAVGLVYPNGRLPDTRWQGPVRVLAGALVISYSVGLLRPGNVVNLGPPNPLALDFLPGWLFDVANIAGLVALVGLSVIGVAAVVVRFRRARDEERAQLKWLTFVVVVWAVIVGASLMVQNQDLFSLALGSLLLVPAAIVIAITRYRLYEIDTLINRTVVYLVLIGFVAGLYAALIVLFQRIFVLLTGDTSDAAAIISALILAAVFSPLRKVIEGIVDRRFKATPAAVGPAIAPATVWDGPEFEAAVERIVRRVRDETRAQ